MLYRAVFFAFLRYNFNFVVLNVLVAFLLEPWDNLFGFLEAAGRLLQIHYLPSKMTGIRSKYCKDL